MKRERKREEDSGRERKRGRAAHNYFGLEANHKLAAR